MKPKITQTEEDLKNHLTTQFHLLAKACLEFDKGDHYQVIVISTILRTLLKDGKPGSQTKSLISQTIGTKEYYSYCNKPEFPKSQDDNIVIQMLHYNFITSILSGHPRHDFSPNFANDVTPSLITFERWWTETVCSDSNNTPFTRQDLILSITEQDGGAHVDEKLGEDYYNLTRNSSQGQFKFNINLPLDKNGAPIWPEVWPADAPPIPLQHPVWHAVRQIAHEVLESNSVALSFNPKVFYKGAGFKMSAIALGFIPE